MLSGLLAASCLALRSDRPAALYPPGADLGGGCRPRIIVADSVSCSWSLKDDTTGLRQRYLEPLEAFRDRNPRRTVRRAREFAANVRADLPFRPPSSEPDVVPTSGWLYDDGEYHGGVDYSREPVEPGEDPSFQVHAVAAGRVVASHWDSWLGNVVVLEHVSPGGRRYRSVYAHLRNGFSHDLRMARRLGVRSVPTRSTRARSHRLRYRRYAWRSNPSPIQWGREDQTVAVRVGQSVGAGQLLGWSGNTGPGGAGFGLSADGTPLDPNVGNVHLHLELLVPVPGRESTWVQVDPYGVYSTIRSGCYDEPSHPGFARLFPST